MADDLDFDELMEEPEPGEFVLPFGKHAGNTLNRVAGNPEGVAYLRWFADSVDSGEADIVKCFLAELEELDPP